MLTAPLTRKAALRSPDTRTPHPAAPAVFPPGDMSLAADGVRLRRVHGVTAVENENRRQDIYPEIYPEIKAHIKFVFFSVRH